MRPSTPSSGQSTRECPNSLNSSKKASKIKRLRNEIDFLSNENNVLQEQLELAKVSIWNLESSLREKGEELNALKFESVHHGLKEQTSDPSNSEGVSNEKDNCESISCAGGEIVLSGEERESNQTSEREKQLLLQIEIYVNNLDQLKREKSLVERENSELVKKIQALENQIISVDSELLQMTSLKTKVENEVLEMKDNILKTAEINQMKISELEELKKELNEIILSKERENEKLRQEVMSSHSECDEMNFKFNDLQIRFEELSNEKENLIKTKDEHISSLGLSIFTLNEKISRSQEYQASFCQQTENEIENLKDQLKKAEEREITLTDSFKETISNAMQEKDNIINDLKTTIECYKKNIEERDSEINSLKEIFDKKESFLSDLKLKNLRVQRELEMNLKEKEDELKLKIKQIRSLEASLNEWAKQNMGINNHLQLLNSELEEKSILIKNNENDLRNLECQNLFLTNTLQEKDSIVVSMQSSIDLLNEELVSLRAKQNSLSSELQSKDSYIFQLQNEMQNLKSSIENKCSENELLLKTIEEKEISLQGWFEEVDQVRVNLNIRLNDLEVQLQEKITKYNELMEERQLKDQELEDSRQQLEYLEDEVKKKEEEIMENINIIGELESETENLKTKTSKLEEKLRLCENKICTTENELLSKSSLITSLTSEVETLKSQENLIRTEKQILKDQILQKTEIINTLEQEKEKKESEVKAQGDKYNREINDLKTIIEGVKCSLNDANTQLVQSKQKIESMNLDLENKSVVIFNYESKIKTYETENELIREENECLVQELSSKGDVVSELKSKISICEDEILRLTDEKVHQTHEIEKYVEKHESQINRIENLQQEIADCKEKEAIQACIIKEKADSVVCLQEFNKQLKESRDTNSQKCYRLETQISSLKDAIRNDEWKIVTQEFKLKEKEASINSLMSTKNVLREKIKVLETAEVFLKKVLKTKDDYIFKLQQQLEEANSKISELQLECSEHNESLKALFKTLSCQNSELKKKCTEAATLQDDETKRMNQQLLEEKVLQAQKKKSKFKRA